MQHKSWKVYAGESTDSAYEVAIMEASHISIGGKHVKIMRKGESEPFLTVKVRILSCNELRPSNSSQWRLEYVCR